MSLVILTLFALPLRKLELVVVFVLLTLLIFIESSNFISQMDLIDLPLLRRNFTWLETNGLTSNRLDVILVSEAWCNIWGSLTQQTLSRDI